MNLEEFEENTGWRGVFHCLPNNKTMAQKVIMPLGFFYSPFLAEVNPIKGCAALCSKCRASVSTMFPKNRNTRTWTCVLCSTLNPYMSEMGNNQV